LCRRELKFFHELAVRAVLHKPPGDSKVENLATLKSLQSAEVVDHRAKARSDVVLFQGDNAAVRHHELAEQFGIKGFDEHRIQNGG